MFLAVSHYHQVVSQKCLWQIQVWAAVRYNWRFTEELGSYPAPEMSRNIGALLGLTCLSWCVSCHIDSHRHPVSSPSQLQPRI